MIGTKKDLVMEQLEKLHSEVLACVQDIEEMKEKANKMTKVWSAEHVNRIEGLRRDIKMVREQEKIVQDNVLDVGVKRNSKSKLSRL